jgi:hypothetical protein
MSKRDELNKRHELLRHDNVLPHDMVVVLVGFIDRVGGVQFDIQMERVGGQVAQEILGGEVDITPKK